MPALARVRGGVAGRGGAVPSENVIPSSWPRPDSISAGEEGELVFASLRGHREGVSGLRRCGGSGGGVGGVWGRPHFPAAAAKVRSAASGRRGLCWPTMAEEWPCIRATTLRRRDHCSCHTDHVLTSSLTQEVHHEGDLSPAGRTVRQPDRRQGILNVTIPHASTRYNFYLHFTEGFSFSKNINKSQTLKLCACNQKVRFDF